MSGVSIAFVLIGVSLCVAALALVFRLRRAVRADRARIDEVTRHAAGQAALLRVSREVARGAGHDRVFRLVADEVSTLFGVPAVCVARIDSPESATVTYSAGKAPAADVHAATSIPLRDESVISRVASCGRPVTIDSYPAGAEPRAGYLRARFAGGAGVPIFAGRTLWGVLAVGRSLESAPFTDDVQETLQAFSELIGLTLVGADVRLRNHIEGLLTTLLDAAPVGAMVLTEDLRVVRLSKTALAHYGPAFDGIVGHTIEKLFPEVVTEMCRFAFAAGEAFRFTLLWGRVRPGGAGLLSVDVRPVRLGDNPTLALVVISEDVSERGRLEAEWNEIREVERDFRGQAAIAMRDLLAVNEEARQAHRRLAQQSEMMRAVTALDPDGIFAVDLDGRFTFLNDAVAARLGTTPEAAIGRDLGEFVPADAATAIRVRGRFALSAGAPEVFEYDLGPPGETTRLLLILAPYTVEGEVFGVAGVARDVTEHHESSRSAEILLARERAAQRMAHDSIQRLEEQNARLLELDHSKDEVLALISHDLRTPLTSILGYAELYLRDADKVEPRHRRYVEVIGRNSQKLVDLLDDLLLVAQYQAGGFAISPQHVDIGPLVVQCAEAAIPLAKKKNILVTHEVEANLAALADPRRLVQLLDNLINNAVKYSERDGFVEISARRTDGKIVLRVRDNGPGIGPEEQRRIFERFTRARDAVQGGVRGFGLGLTIAHAIAEANGGKIGVDSMPGTGSTFWVELDFVPMQVPPGVQPAVTTT
jgi:PAS domain S-box-containing protein